MSVITPAEVSQHIREVTNEEVAFYEENGWVKLDRLVTPELAAELLRVGQSWTKEGEKAGSWNSLAKDPNCEPFHSLLFGGPMGRNAARLVNRKRLTDEEIPLLYRADHFVCRTAESGQRSAYHQDSAEHGSDRVGELQFWLALDEVTPEMGAMRFLTGSHRAGPLGSVFNGGPDLLGVYPKLVEHYPLSPPFHYQPGDATVHHGYMVHGAPPNTTDRPRWCYIYSYTPADTRWWNGKVANWGSERKPLDESLNPVAYPV